MAWAARLGRQAGAARLCPPEMCALRVAEEERGSQERREDVEDQDRASCAWTNARRRTLMWLMTAVTLLPRRCVLFYLTEHTGSTRARHGADALPWTLGVAETGKSLWIADSIVNGGEPRRSGARFARLDAAQHPSCSTHISHVSFCARRAGPRSDSRSCSSCCSTPICRSCANTTRCQGKHKNSFYRRRVRLQHRHRPDGHRRRRRRSCGPRPHLQGHRHLARRRQWRLGW